MEIRTPLQNLTRLQLADFYFSMIREFTEYISENNTQICCVYHLKNPSQHHNGIKFECHIAFCKSNPYVNVCLTYLLHTCMSSKVIGLSLSWITRSNVLEKTDFSKRLFLFGNKHNTVDFDLHNHRKFPFQYGYLVLFYHGYMCIAYSAKNNHITNFWPRTSECRKWR